VPRLPVLSGKEVGRVFEQLGYVYQHHRGSHMIYRKPGAQRLAIPDHRELDRGLLKGLIRDAGLSVEEFLAHCK